VLRQPYRYEHQQQPWAELHVVLVLWIDVRLVDVVVFEGERETGVAEQEGD
jgi:hypothetical protein